MKRITIGKLSTNDIQLTNHPHLSRNQAYITVDDDGSMRLTDTSANGTYVNGEKVHNRSISISRGSSVRFADVQALDWNLLSQFESNNKTKLYNPEEWIRYTPWLAGILGLLLLFFLREEIIDFFVKEKCDLTTIEIAEKYDNSVGMIVGLDYYKAHTLFGRMIYIGINRHYNGPDNYISIAENTELLLPFESYGSGFLVKYSDEDNVLNENYIITNKHVVNSGLSKEDEELADSLAFEYLGSNYDGGDRVVTKWKPVNDATVYIPHATSLYLSNNSPIGVRHNTYRVNGITLNLIGYHANDNVDLALLKCNENSNIKNYTQIDLNAVLNTTQQATTDGEEVFILGFSGGFQNTYDSKLKVIERLLNYGPVSNRSRYRMNYNMSNARGSSGSPIFNSCGELVAVHYASSSTQETNQYGILSEFIVEMFNEENFEPHEE